MIAVVIEVCAEAQTSMPIHKVLEKNQRTNPTMNSKTRLRPLLNTGLIP